MKKIIVFLYYFKIWQESLCKLCARVCIFLAITEIKSLNFFMIRLHAEINESFVKKEEEKKNPHLSWWWITHYFKEKT